jgi:hypothetical protein
MTTIALPIRCPRSSDLYDVTLARHHWACLQVAEMRAQASPHDPFAIAYLIGRRRKWFEVPERLRERVSA